MTGNMIGAAVCFSGGLALIGWMVHRFCVMPVERALDAHSAATNDPDTRRFGTLPGNPR